MAQRLTRNSFEGGLNTDVSKSKLNPSFYTAAHNLDSVADGDFFALKNIKGTTQVKELTVASLSGAEILAVFNNRYLIDEDHKECLTIFTVVDGGAFRIWCYDTESGTLYALFSETVAAGYLTDDRTIDGFGYAENNTDHLYFTDNDSELRFLRCEIPSTYTDNFLTVGDLSLQRRGANGRISLSSVSSGGSLLSGAYQYAYRLVDPDTNRYTKWSSLSLPYHVYAQANSSLFVHSDYGLPTTFKISLDISIPIAERDQFDYFQLAVIENVYPTGPETVVDGENQTFIASLLPIEAISDYESSIGSGSLSGYEHKANSKVNIIPVDDLVVDYATIKSAKTINVKEKRLVAANITYHSFEFDNGEPTLVVGDPFLNSGLISRTSSSGDLFSSHEESLYRGYFRDEVYRFGIVYFDKFGNKSPVKVLHLNSLPGNQISGSLPDVRFPSRSTSNAYTIFDTNNRLKSLGLQLVIKNHPSWAVGFEIVRAKRIKKILAQTPVIPMTYVEGIGALDSYPSLGTIPKTILGVVNVDFPVEYPNATPQTTSKVFVPKNLFWPDLRSIERAGTSSGSGQSFIARGEAGLERITSATSMAMIFPQNHIYRDGVFTLTGAEKIKTIDYAALKLSVDDSTGNDGVAGENSTTKIKGTFYALDKGDYYFDPSWSSKSISEEYPVKGYTTFDNLSVGSSLNARELMTFDTLQTEGVELGVKPNIQRCVIVDTPGGHHDITSSKVFASAGTKNTVAGGAAVFSSNGSLKYESALTNKYVNEYSGFSNKNSYVQAVKIVNIELPYSDDRYGDESVQHEFISTGAKHYFSSAQLTQVQAGNPVYIQKDVWGGDCFVAPHTFKVADGAYSVVNQAKQNGSFDSYNTLVGKWGVIFKNRADAAISFPVGIEAATQFITVVLESEYNGGVMAEDVFIDDGSSNGIPIPTISIDSDLYKSPLTYRYNINLSKQNDQKVYFAKPAFHNEKVEFPSRVMYTDQKIYNTDSVGFDIFRVLNFLDLEEKNGEITKLAVEGDRLYAIQERGIVNLPVGETQITTTDAGQLAVGTSDFFGRPIVIDNKKGSQHIRGIVEAGDKIYIPDHANKAVYVLTGNQLISISSETNNATLFRELFSIEASERNLMGIYDPLRKQYWIADQDYCYLFNEEKKQWVSNLEFPVGSLRGGVFTNKNLFLIGSTHSVTAVHTMYTGDPSQLFGTTVTPRLTFIVNPDDPISKIFTNQAYISTERLATADFTIEREEELADQTISGTIIAVSPRGGNYRIKLSRAADNERLRGLRLITTVKWKTTGFSSLSEVLTKYRHESRSPF